jgi:hypothetical protein
MQRLPYRAKKYPHQTKWDIKAAMMFHFDSFSESWSFGPTEQLSAVQQISTVPPCHASMLWKQTLWLLVPKQAILTERPPLVSELSANFSEQGDVMWSAQQAQTAVNIGFMDRDSSLILMRLSRPCSRSTTYQKIWVAPRIEPGTSGSVARNSDLQTTIHNTQHFTTYIYPK